MRINVPLARAVGAILIVIALFLMRDNIHKWAGVIVVLSGLGILIFASTFLSHWQKKEEEE